MAGRFGKTGLLGSAPPVVSSQHGETLSSRVFVANVPVEVVEKLHLHSRFSKYGIVKEVIIHRKGFAFVQFKNGADALAAIKGESGTYLEGGRISCNLTKHERIGPPGPRTLPGKEIVIGESDGGSSNGGGDGHLSSNRNWSSQNVGGSSASCQEEKPSVDQTEQDWETNNSRSPVKHASPSPVKQAQAQQSSSDHSLTLGLFVNKSKKASKLVPFKKSTAKTEKSPEKSSAAPSNVAVLRSSNLSNFKFDEGTSSSSGYKPEAGPFEELWDSDFSDEFKDESCLAGDSDAPKSSSLKRQLTDKSKDGGREDATIGAEQKSEQISNSMRKVAVEVPASLITPSHISAKAAVEVKVPASFITPSHSSPPKTAVEVKVPASMISPNHSSPKAAVEVKVPASLINTSANFEKSDPSNWDSRPIDNSRNDNNDASWDEDNEPPFVMPIGKQELCSSTDGLANKSKASSVSPNQPSKDAQAEFNWDDEEEIDVVGTPPDSVAGGSNPSRGQDEALRVEEVVHVETKSQSVTYVKSTSTPSESVSEATFKNHSNPTEKTFSVSQANNPSSFGTCSIQNQDTRLANHSSAIPSSGLTSLVYSTRVTPTASVASVSRQFIPPLTVPGVPIRVIQSQPQRTGPPMASNFLVPMQQTTMASLGQPTGLGPPPSAINCGPPPGPPPIPPPQQQQTYSSVPFMMPVRAAPNITYGSLYPSRRIEGTVGGYMAYNVSMGGQPMYQQGQPVGQMMQQEPPTPTSSNQMMTSPVEPQRQRHMSGPLAPVYMQNQVETYGPPPPPSPSPNGYPTTPSPGPSNYAPPTPPSPVPVQRERHLSGPTMPSYQEQQSGPTVSRMSTTYLASSHPYGMGMKNLTMSASAPLEQQIGYKRDPSFPLTDIEKGKINSEFKEALQTAGGPLDVTDNTILRIYMVLPEPIRRGIRRMGGLKTYFEQSESFDVRGDLIGLPGQIKRTPVTIQPPPGRYQPRKSGGSLSGEAAEFVPGEQRSRSSSTSSSYSTSGNLQQETTSKMSTFGKSSSSGSGFGSGSVGFGSSNPHVASGSVGSGRVGFGASNQNAASGTPGFSRPGFGSSNTSSTRSGFGFSNMSATSSNVGSVRSGFGSSQDTSNQGFASMAKFGTRQESVTDNVKAALRATCDDPYNLANPYDSYYPLRADLQRTASVDGTGDSSKEKKDNTVYTLVKDAPVADDLWELDSFLTEAYGGGYYQDYLALSKELEKQSSQATQKSASSQDKSQTATSQDSSQSTKEANVQSKQSGQDTKASASSHFSSSSASIGPSSSQDDAKYTKDSSHKEQDKESTAQTIQNTTSTARPTQDEKDSVDQTGATASSVELPSKPPPAVENTCQANVIDPSKFEKKTTTTFAAKLLKAASIHSESTCERVDGRAAVSGEDQDASDKDQVIKVEVTDEGQLVTVEETDVGQVIKVEETDEGKKGDVEKTDDGKKVKVEKTDEEEFVEVEKAVEEAIEEELAEENTGEGEIKEAVEEEVAEEKTGRGETRVGDVIEEDKKAEAAGDKGDTSKSSWSTISDETPLTKQQMADKYLLQSVLKEMAKGELSGDDLEIVTELMPMVGLTYEPPKSTKKSKSSDTGGQSESDAAMPASVSTGAEGVKSGQKKVRCAAVFNVAHGSSEQTEKVDGKEEGEACDAKISEEEPSLKPNDHGASGSSDGKLERAENERVSVKEETADDKLRQTKGELQDTDVDMDLVRKTIERALKEIKKKDSEDLVESSAVDEKTDKVQDEKTGANLGEGLQKRHDATGESVPGLEKVVKPDPDAGVVVKSNADDTAVTQAESLAVDPDTTNKEDETFCSLKDDDENDICPDNSAKSVKDSSQVVVKAEEDVPQDESSIKQEIEEERPHSPIHEEIIQQCKVKEVNVKEYLASAAAKQDHGAISIGVNTDQVKTVHKGIVTSKVPKISRVTNTVAVPKVTRCVGTFEDFEKTYYEKNIDLENQIRLLEESLEDERDKATLQKHSHQVEVRTLKDQLETLTRKKNEFEDQLKIRKRQQVSEMRKTTAELRDTDARYSAQKSKVTSLEKENACITKELSAVTRELFDLQAIMETETIRNHTLSIDETTSTDELEEVQRQFERRMEIGKQQRENQLLERAQQAELKILKMQLDNCQKSYTKTQEQGQQTYSIYANSPQISAHEKLYVNRQWSSYQNRIQEATEQLLVDYERNELLLKEGASLAELTPLQVSQLEPFTPRTSGPSSSSRGAPSPLSAGFTIPSTSQQPTDTANRRRPSSELNVESSDTISDAGLDELKDMTSRLLQPDMDISKPTPSVPNLAGSAPLFSLGQQPSSAHHPYTRNSREDRLRCIQRRLGLNPDTGKPFASRGMNKSPASSASSTAAPSEQTADFVVAATAAAKATTAARNPLLGSSAFNFAMKQRSLAAKSSRPSLSTSLATSLASTYKKCSQSSSSEDTTARPPLVLQPSMPTTAMPPPLYPDFPSGITPHARSLSSPSGQAASQPEPASTHYRHHVEAAVGQPEVASTHYSHQAESAIPTRMIEITVLPEPSNVEGFVEEGRNNYEQPTSQYQYQEGVDSHAGTASSYRQETGMPPISQNQYQEEVVDSHAGTASSYRQDTEMPPISQNQSETASYQTDVYQSESDYFSSPEKTDRGHQQQEQPQPQQYYEEQKQEEQQSSQEDGPINKSVEEEYEITYVFTDDISGSPEPGKKQPYMQLDPVETNPATEPLSTSPSIESSSRDSSQPEEPPQKPEPAAMPEVPQFPKSEAIQATRSKSPTNDHLGQRWDNLPPRLKSRVVPRMTRSGGVTLKAIGRSQSEETGSKSRGSGKRKGSGSGAAWGGASSVGGLAPIDDADDGWTTVVGKRKKKALDIVEQQQQQAQQPKQEAPKPLSKGTGSLDKIRSALARQFPGITRKEVMDTMKQVRLDHRGSLSGVSMAVLVKEASSHIKNTNPKYMTSKPTKHAECDDICVICQDDLRVKPGGSKRGGPVQADIRMLDCGHMFHDDCLRTWYDTRERTCPICRCHTLLPDDYPPISLDDFPALGVA